MADSTEAKIFKTRYSDGYIVARVTVGFGVFIKIAGATLGGLIALGSFIVASSDSGSTGGLLIFGGILFGAAVAFSFYIWGILVSAQGQILKATLDTAVNGSPFLTNTEKAGIMSLNRFPQSEGVKSEQQVINERWRCLCGGSNPQNVTTCAYCGRAMYADS